MFNRINDFINVNLGRIIFYMFLFSVVFVLGICANNDYKRSVQNNSSISKCELSDGIPIITWNGFLENCLNK